jgi:DNA-directed RNA polymerase subunit RPC12/RpoP
MQDLCKPETPGMAEQPKDSHPKPEAEVSRDNLFGDKPRVYRCVGCGGPVEIERLIAPGVTQYRCVARCGAVGIERVDDDYQKPQIKKPYREPYHQSRYRGGKLKDGKDGNS